jgi:hypothetical protein
MKESHSMYTNSRFVLHNSKPVEGQEVETSKLSIRCFRDPLAALSLPLALLAAFVFARLAGKSQRARNLLRTLRYVLAAEILAVTILALTGFAYERRAGNAITNFTDDQRS